MIDRQQVEHVAQLARLRLSDEELDRLPGQLEQILESFSALNELNVEGIPPTAQVIPLHNVERDDAVTPCLPVEAVLANAPRVEDDQIRVPAVLDQS